MANKTKNFLKVYTGPNQFATLSLAEADKKIIKRLYANKTEPALFFNNKDQKRMDILIRVGIIQQYLNRGHQRLKLTLFGESVYNYMETQSSRVGIVEVCKTLKEL